MRSRTAACSCLVRFMLSDRSFLKKTGSQQPGRHSAGCGGAKGGFARVFKQWVGWNGLGGGEGRGLAT